METGTASPPTALPLTPLVGGQLASKPSSMHATPSTPTPANLIFAHRIRSLARNEGDPDDSPLISGRPPGSRWMDDREGSTTPEGPPPLRVAQRQQSMAALNTASSTDERAASLSRPTPTGSPPTAVDDRDDAASSRSTTSSSAGSHLLSRSIGQTFKARPAPPTTWAPEHPVRQSRASLLRAGADPDALGSSNGSSKGAGHVPTDFTAVPGHKRSRSNLQLDVPSIKAPTHPPRENRASLIRQGKAPAPLRRMSTDNLAAQAALYAHTPGHRRSETISVASTLPPSVAPRQTRASSLRAKDDAAGRAYQAIEQEKAAARAERVKVEAEKKAERRRSTVAPLPGIAHLPRVKSVPDDAGTLHRRRSTLAPVACPPRSVSSASVDVVSIAEDEIAPIAQLVLVRRPHSALSRSASRSGSLAPSAIRAEKAQETFANVPGHKRRQSIQVHSTTTEPLLAPRQNRAALLRSSLAATIKSSNSVAGAATRPSSRVSTAGNNFQPAAFSRSTSATGNAPVAGRGSLSASHAPSSFRPMPDAPARPGGEELARPPSASATRRGPSPAPGLVPRENRAAELRRLRRTSVAF